MGDNFFEYAQYYDLLYRDKDYQAEADYVADLIRKLNPQVRTVLELGSGTGIHATLLAARGFEVHGIERSEEMLRRSILLGSRSSSQSGRVSFSRGDIREARLHQTFDAVIALFHVISYQTTNADVTAAFATARAHVASGGLFVFDVWYGPAVLTERPSVRVKRIQDDALSITRLAEPVLRVNENLVDVNYQVFVTKPATQEVRTLKETHVMRYFFKPELERIAAQAGFGLMHVEEWLSGAPLGDATWGACFALRAE